MTDAYQNRYKSDKVAACKAVAQSVADGNAAAAELGINLLNVEISADYGTCVGGSFGTQNLANCKLQGGASVSRAAVVTFVDAVCDLFPALGPNDCLRPTVENLEEPTVAPTDPDAETRGGWIARGPLAQGATVLLPSEEFGVTLDALVAGASGNTFVTLREEEQSGAFGQCPPGFLANHDCQGGAWYGVDADFGTSNDPILDAANGGLGGLYVEICENESFVDVPGRCAGGVCAPANETPTRGILSCSRGALGFAPSFWTGQDKDIAVREILCAVTSTSAANSAGTTCTVHFPQGSTNPVPGATCATTTTGQKTSECIIGVPLEAEGATPGVDVCYTMRAEKTDQGVSHSGSTDFCIAQADPLPNEIPGVPEKTVAVSVLPQGQQ